MNASLENSNRITDLPLRISLNGALTRALEALRAVERLVQVLGADGRAIGRLVVAMLVRHSAENTFTMGELQKDESKSR